MVTEYNRNLIMQRRLAAEKAAAELEKAGAVVSANAKPVEVKPAEEKPVEKAEPVAVKAEKAETAKPKKTDAEKLKKGRK